MNILDIENLSTENKNKWEVYKEYKNYKSLLLLARTMSTFSVLFSTSVVLELFKLNLNILVIVLFSLFMLSIIILNEVLKLNNFIALFFNKKTTETKIIACICVSLSLFISNYGVYNFLNSKDDFNNKIKSDNTLVISNINAKYNQKTDSILKIDISNVSEFNSKMNVFNTQLEQYTLDRERYKNKIALYNDINNKIDKINMDIINLQNDFNVYKSKKIDEINALKNKELTEINTSSIDTISSVENKNNVILILFLFCALLIDGGIIYLCFKIGKNKTYNKEIDDEKEKLYNEKINHIKSTKEYESFIVYKNLIDKIYNSRSKSDPITFNDFSILLKDKKMTKNEIDDIIDELRGIGIVSASVKRIGSKLQLTHDEALNALRKYYQPYFSQY